MKKTWLFLLIVPVFCISCITPFVEQPKSKPDMEEVSPFIEISHQDQLALKHLSAKKENFSYQDKQLLLGDKSTAAKQKQFFLIHNKTRDPIILDFPKGHVGATAGIMQMIQPNEWYAYLYIKGKDYRPVESSNHKKRYGRPTWTCQKGSPDYEKYDSCEDYLDIYSIDYNLSKLKATQNSLDYNLLKILTYNNRTKWLTHISALSIHNLLRQIHTVPVKKSAH